MFLNLQTFFPQYYTDNANTISHQRNQFQVLTLSDMAPGRCAPAWGGHIVPRHYKFLPKCLNQFF